MKRVILHAKRRVFDGFFKLDEAEVSYERFNGLMSGRVRRLCLERGDSVAAIIYNRDSQKALLVNQFKYPTYEKGPGWIIETVAGIIENGETPESAVRREVLEETGYAVEILEHIGTFYVSPGGSSERILLYFAEVSDKVNVGPGGGVESEGEDIETVEFSIDELDHLLETHSVQDAKTIVAIQWLLRRFESRSRR
jgi:nudix-type nucleoside diphosphatase (YffH/AdpP family)